MEMATRSCILAWEIPWNRGALQGTVLGRAKSWTRLSGLAFMQVGEIASLKCFS